MLLSLISALMSGESLGFSMAVQFCVLIFIVICCFPIHESAHAWAAERLGDSTGRLSGRITLNPLAHLDVLGTIMILLFGFGYAKPVPVNIRNFPPEKRKVYFGLTAAAGPASNLLLAVIFTLISNIIGVIAGKSGGASTVTEASILFCTYASYINVSLAVFNLIPIPPLDGSRILTAVLPDRIYYKIMQYERYSMYALFLLIFLFNRLGFSPISMLAGLVNNLIDWLVGLPFRLIG